MTLTGAHLDSKDGFTELVSGKFCFWSLVSGALFWDRGAAAISIAPPGNAPKRHNPRLANSFESSSGIPIGAEGDGCPAEWAGDAEWPMRRFDPRQLPTEVWDENWKRDRPRKPRQSGVRVMNPNNRTRR